MNGARHPPAAGTRQVRPEHYEGLEYDSKTRFISYWHQIEVVLRCSPGSVLEIGIGNGFVSRHLQSKGIRVETLDFDAALAPRVAASAAALPFRSGSFDLVLCCEVLEHMPYEDVPTALDEFRRVSRGHVVVSVPNVRPCLRVILPIPAYREIQLLLPSFWRPRPRHVTCPDEHWWELGMQGFPPERFLNTLESAGLTLLREYRLFDVPFHHFFELEV